MRCAPRKSSHRGEWRWTERAVCASRLEPRGRAGIARGSPQLMPARIPIYMYKSRAGPGVAFVLVRIDDMTYAL